MSGHRVPGGKNQILVYKGARIRRCPPGASARHHARPSTCRAMASGPVKDVKDAGGSLQACRDKVLRKSLRLCLP